MLNDIKTQIHFREILISILICHLSYCMAVHNDIPNSHKSKIPSPILASMTWSQDKGFNLLMNEISKIPETVGWVNFTNAINQTGWSYLEIKTDEKFPDKIQVSSYEKNSIFKPLFYLPTYP